MRNISFALTTQQFRDRTKTVTRRLGWRSLKPGDRLCGCVKCQGLKPGEKLERLGVIEIVSVTDERLDRMTTDPEYGDAEATLEGFPDMTGPQFVEMFCDHMAVNPSYVINRIEYRYV